WRDRIRSITDIPARVRTPNCRRYDSKACGGIKLRWRNGPRFPCLTYFRCAARRPRPLAPRLHNRKPCNPPGTPFPRRPRTPRICGVPCAVPSASMPSNPIDEPEKDLPLRDDIRLLGRILGDTVREQEGEAVFDIVEQIRRTSIRFHRDEDAKA